MVACHHFLVALRRGENVYIPSTSGIDSAGMNPRRLVKLPKKVFLSCLSGRGPRRQQLWSGGWRQFLGTVCIRPYA